MEIKTQTSRATRYKTKVINLNIFCGDFLFGIITSNYWGDFKEREEPLIEISIKGKSYSIGLVEFIRKIEPILKKSGGFDGKQFRRFIG